MFAKGSYEITLQYKGWEMKENKENKRQGSAFSTSDTNSAKLLYCLRHCHA